MVIYHSTLRHLLVASGALDHPLRQTWLHLALIFYDTCFYIRIIFITTTYQLELRFILNLMDEMVPTLHKPFIIDCYRLDINIFHIFCSFLQILFFDIHCQTSVSSFQDYSILLDVIRYYLTIPNNLRNLMINVPQFTVSSAMKTPAILLTPPPQNHRTARVMISPTLPSPSSAPSSTPSHCRRPVASSS